MPNNSHHPSDDGLSASILVVEDNADLNLAICETLEGYNYSVKSATNGVEALELLQGYIPDVILCDIMMPEMDGYALLQKTRADSKLRTLPFIFLTARTSTTDKRRAKEIGIEDYLTKPVDSGDLVAAINNALRRRKMMAEEMQKQTDDLRNQIVGVLQHEFRTPLTFVLGYGEYLLDATEGPIDVDDFRNSIAAILEGGRRLHRLIESFLMFAELQNRRLEPEQMDPLNLLLLWKNTAQNSTPQLAEADMTVEISEQNGNDMVSGDAELLNEALKRLLDNAIRYRRPESKKIWLSVERLAPTDKRVTHVGLRIRDESAGIPEEQIAQLVRPFEQVDRNDRTQPGAGLSLAMIHHIVQLHGGSLEIQSEYGQGSTFTLWLPAADDLTN